MAATTYSQVAHVDGMSVSTLLNVTPTNGLSLKTIFISGRIAGPIMGDLYTTSENAMAQVRILINGNIVHESFTSDTDLSSFGGFVLVHCFGDGLTFDGSTTLVVEVSQMRWSEVRYSVCAFCG